MVAAVVTHRYMRQAAAAAIVPRRRTFPPSAIIARPMERTDD